MRYFNIFIIVSVLLLTACSKNGKSKGEGIYDTWKLTASLMDPGDGSGTWQNETGSVKTIGFNANGIFSTNTLWHEFNRYNIIDDQQLVLYKGSDSASFNQTLRYKLDDNKLELNPQCFEACGFRFERVTGK